MSQTSQHFPSQWLNRYTVAAASLVTFLAAALYLSTAAPGLTWAHGGSDGGDLATAAYTGGVPHPPGYPTYMLAARLAIALQDGPIAARTNRLSAFAGALSAGLLVLLSSLLIDLSELSRTGTPEQTRQRPASPFSALCAALAGLVYATAPLVWEQAVITEVYMVGSLFILTSVPIAVIVSAQPHSSDRPWLSIFLGVLGGLGFGAHPSVIFAAIFAGILLLATKGRTAIRPLTLATLGGLAGLLVFALLPGWANRAPTSNWGDVRDFSSILWMLTGQAYSGVLQVGVFPERLVFLLRKLLADFTVPGVFLALYGFWTFWETCPRVALAAALTILLNVLFTTMYYAENTLPYLLISYAFVAFWLGLGVSQVARSLVRAPPRLGGAMPIGIVAVATLGISITAAANFTRIDSSHRHDAEDFGRLVMDTLPPNAIVLTDDDDSTFALWYAQTITRQRPDVLVLDTRLVDWPWYRATIARFYTALVPDAETLARPVGALAVELAPSPNSVTSATHLLFATFNPTANALRAESVLVAEGVTLFRLTRIGP
jgi:hypothetical protein